MDLSIVIPAFEEALRLPSALPQLLGVIDASRTEIIIVDDGSSDETTGVARRLVADLPHAEVLSLAHRGKGASVRAGVQRATGDAIVFMDADMATDPADVPRLVEALVDADVAIGSRAVDGSTTDGARIQRVAMGRAFNLIVRTTTHLPFRDTQCGFKGFRNQAAKRLFGLSRIDGFAFDVELLLLAERLRYSVVEVPVHWRGVTGSHVNPVTDSVRMITGVAQAAHGARLVDTGLGAPALPAPQP